MWETYSDLGDAEWIHSPVGPAGAGMLPHVVAAIRETFEEAGILLAHTDPGEDIEELVRTREKGELPSGWLQAWVVSRGWRLAASRLHPWAHWVTPPVRSKRFDTRFFVTVVPRGTSCIPDGRETVQGVWVEPEEALSGNQNGYMALSPPTLVTLHELLVHRNIESLQGALENRMWGTPRCPRLIPATDGFLLLLPWDPVYGHNLRPGRAPGAVLAVGEPFSRMWLQSGIWRPVAG